MNDNINEIQDIILSNLRKLDKEDKNIIEEVARSNAIARMAVAYIHTCNFNIQLEEKKKSQFKSNMKALLSEKK